MIEVDYFSSIQVKICLCCLLNAIFTSFCALPVKPKLCFDSTQTLLSAIATDNNFEILFLNFSLEGVTQLKSSLYFSSGVSYYLQPKVPNRRNKENATKSLNLIFILTSIAHTIDVMPRYLLIFSH